MPVDGVRGLRTMRLHGIFALLMALLFMPVACADTPDELRLLVASRFFPSLLAADLQLEQKSFDNNRLLILVVYLDDRATAERAAAEIDQVSQIRQHALDVRTVTVAGLAAYDKSILAGVFIGDKLYEQLSEVLAFAHQRSAITFSPYPGDVEMGVVGGIQVRDRILPYINLRAMRDASLQLRPFYLKVAETYEPK